MQCVHVSGKYILQYQTGGIIAEACYKINLWRFI